MIDNRGRGSSGGQHGDRQLDNRLGGLFEDAVIEAGQTIDVDERFNQWAEAASAVERRPVTAAKGAAGLRPLSWRQRLSLFGPGLLTAAVAMVGLAWWAATPPPTAVETIDDNTASTSATTTVSDPVAEPYLRNTVVVTVPNQSPDTRSTSVTSPGRAAPPTPSTSDHNTGGDQELPDPKAPTVPPSTAAAAAPSTTGVPATTSTSTTVGSTTATDTSTTATSTTDTSTTETSRTQTSTTQTSSTETSTTETTSTETTNTTRSETHTTDTISDGPEPILVVVKSTYIKSFVVFGADLVSDAEVAPEPVDHEDGDAFLIAPVCQQLLVEAPTGYQFIEGTKATRTIAMSFCPPDPPTGEPIVLTFRIANVN
jgi:hypothetical protein